MSPRLLRPILSGDPDALRYIAAVQQADQQSLEPAVRKAITDFVVGCKADGIWSAFRTAGILAGARTLSGALVPLVGSSVTNNNFVSGDYERKTGLVGNGSTKSITLPFNGGDVAQDNIHAATWVHTSATPGSASFPTYIGAGSSSTGSTVIGRLQNSGQLYFQARTGTAVLVNNSAGFHAVSRNTSASFVRRLSGTSATVTSASQSPFTTHNFSLFRDLQTNVAWSNGRQSFWSAGESLDLALLETRVSTLLTAIGAAIP
jgi:hypothetical protein